MHSSLNSYLPSWPTILNCKTMMMTTTTTTTIKQNNITDEYDDDDDDSDSNRQKTERIKIFLLLSCIFQGRDRRQIEV